MLNQLVAIIM